MMDYYKEFILAKMLVKFTFEEGGSRKTEPDLQEPLEEGQYYKAVWRVSWFWHDKKEDEEMESWTDEDWWLRKDFHQRNEGWKQTSGINYEWWNAFKNASIDI